MAGLFDLLFNPDAAAVAAGQALAPSPRQGVRGPNADPSRNPFAAIAAGLPEDPNLNLDPFIEPFSPSNISAQMKPEGVLGTLAQGAQDFFLDNPLTRAMSENPEVMRTLRDAGTNVTDILQGPEGGFGLPGMGARGLAASARGVGQVADLVGEGIEAARPAVTDMLEAEGAPVFDLPSLPDLPAFAGMSDDDKVAAAPTVAAMEARKGKGNPTTNFDKEAAKTTSTPASLNAAANEDLKTDLMATATTPEEKSFMENLSEQVDLVAFGTTLMASANSPESLTASVGRALQAGINSKSGKAEAARKAALEERKVVVDEQRNRITQWYNERKLQLDKLKIDADAVKAATGISIPTGPQLDLVAGFVTDKLDTLPMGAELANESDLQTITSAWLDAMELAPKGMTAKEVFEDVWNARAKQSDGGFFSVGPEITF